MADAAPACRRPDQRPRDRRGLGRDAAARRLDPRRHRQCLGHAAQAGGFPASNPVARALREIGRIERTLFMLDWFADPEQRRRTGSILNKGEARNALARAIFFNRLGELRDRTFENQRHRASGLTLLTAAVTLWNTVYLDRAVRHLRASGIEVPDELLAHVAPLGWEHIGLTGDYLWSEMDKPRERFRPLRLHQNSRDA